MVVSLLRLDYNIINVVLETLMQHIMKDGTHGTLICRACIFKSKGHGCLVEIAHGCLEGRSLDVQLVYFDLVVATESFYERKH